MYVVERCRPEGYDTPYIFWCVLAIRGPCSIFGLARKLEKTKEILA